MSRWWGFNIGQIFYIICSFKEWYYDTVESGRRALSPSIFQRGPMGGPQVEGVYYSVFWIFSHRNIMPFCYSLVYLKKICIENWGFLIFLNGALLLGGGGGFTGIYDTVMRAAVAMGLWKSQWPIQGTTFWNLQEVALLSFFRIHTSCMHPLWIRLIFT